MSVERLVWHALLQNKVRLGASVAAVACVFVSSILAFNATWSGGHPGYLVLLIAPIVSATCSVGWSERRTRSRVLFRVGFSHEQLATLLALEGVAIGALGAMLGILASVALWFGLSNRWWDGSRLGLWTMAENLSFTFCVALIVSALAAVGPAYRFARAGFEEDDGRN